MFPFVTSFIYIFFSIYYHSKNERKYRTPYASEYGILAMNLAITEIFLYFLAQTSLVHGSFSVLFFIGFVLVQDVYFYVLHYMMHIFLYHIHKIHHSYYAPFTAWMSHPLEHLFLNLGSLFVALYVFPQPYIICTILSLTQPYTSVNGHTAGDETTPSPVHEIHHTTSMRRFGTGFYLTDRIVGTF